METLKRKTRNLWLTEAMTLGFQLHPVILMSMGLLQPDEAFFVLMLAYFIPGVLILVKSSFILAYDCIKVRFPKLDSVVGKFSEAMLYLLGWGIMMFIHAFLLLLFFGILYDGIRRQQYYNPAFSGDGAALTRTLWINSAYFLIVELVSLVNYFRNYVHSDGKVLGAYFLGIKTGRTTKWNYFPLIWLVIFYVFFLFMCTGFAFKAAILSFFVFDIGFVLLRRLEEKHEGIG